MERYNYWPGFNATENPAKGTGSDLLKHTSAAFTILIGLTALMIGLYLNEFYTLAQILHGYVAVLP